MSAMLLAELNSLLLSYLNNFKYALLSLSAICIFSMLSVSANALEIGEQAPDFELTTFSGDSFKLSDYRSVKPLYLVFWATWCPNCQAEISTLKKLHAQLGSRVAMLAINIGFEDSLAKAQLYQRKHQLPDSVSFDQNTVLSRA